MNLWDEPRDEPQAVFDNWSHKGYLTFNNDWLRKLVPRSAEMDCSLAVYGGGMTHNAAACGPYCMELE